MDKNFKISKVRKALRLVANEFKPVVYSVYKVTGPRKIVKYFSLKKEATAWVKGFTTRQPLTNRQIQSIMAGTLLRP